MDILCEGPTSGTEHECSDRVTHFIPLIGDYVQIVKDSGEKVVGTLIDTLGHLHWKIRTEDHQLIEIFGNINFSQHALTSGKVLYGNIYDPIWKRLVSINLVIGLASSNRTHCEICKTKVSKGYARVGHVRRWWIENNKRFHERTWWYHAQCLPLNDWVLNDDILSYEDKRLLHDAQFQQSPPIATTEIKTDIDTNNNSSSSSSNDIAAIQKACRNAISREIIQFKATYLENSATARCPITNTVLEMENSHVHHQYPLPFSDIVHMFVKNYPDIRTSAIMGAEFKNYLLRQLFADYHRRLARLLVVHAKTNLSYLKKNSTFGACDQCKKT